MMNAFAIAAAILMLHEPELCLWALAAILAWAYVR